MAHPSVQYIKYLLVKCQVDGIPLTRVTEKGTVVFNEEVHEEINYALIECDMPSVASKEVYRLGRRMPLPKGFQFWNHRHAATAEFMEKHGIKSIWDPDEGELELFQLLRNAQVKDTVKILLMGHFSAVEISSRIHQKYKINIPAPAIAIFKQYFWNVEGTSANEWKHHLHNNALKGHLLAALHGSPAQALYRAGFNPRVEGVVALKDVQRTLHFRLEATRMMSDSSDAAAVISRLSKELVAIHSVLYSEGAGLEEILKKFREWKIQLKEADVVPIGQLAPAGNYSESGSTDKGNGRTHERLYNANPRVVGRIAAKDDGGPH